MKYLFILFSATLCMLMACNSHKKQGEVTVTREDGKTTTKEEGNLVQSDEATQKRIEELQKLSPYTLDQMEALLPEELAGAKRSTSSAKSMMGTAYSEGEYEINDSTKVELKLFDCAGPAGTGIYNSQFLSMLNFQSETDDEYSKTIDFNGARAIEQVRKDGSRATLIYLAADRLYVTLEGRNTGIEQLKKIAGSLNLK